MSGGQAGECGGCFLPGAQRESVCDQYPKGEFCCVVVLCASVESTELEDIENKVSNIRTLILSKKSEPVTHR